MVFTAPNTNPSKDDHSELYSSTERYPFQLSSWQLWTILSLMQGKNALTCAPTGSGKTLAADWAIEYFVKSKGKKVIYCSPIKALSNYMKYDFVNQHPDISFGIITGDQKDNPDADCIICTTECLRNYLFTSETDAETTTLDFNMNIKDDVGIIIYDEAHYFNDKDRGEVWESCFIKQPNNVQMLLMSATLHNPSIFASWLETVSQTEVCLAETHVRAVPLEHNMFFVAHQAFSKKIKDKQLIKQIEDMNNKSLILKDKEGFNDTNYNKVNAILRELSKHNVYIKRNFVLNKMVEFLKNNDKLPAILFVYSRKGVEQLAKEIVHNLHTDPTYPNIVSKVAGDILREKLPNANEYMMLPEYNQILKLLEKGIGIHHAGMLPVFRELIEKIFKKGFIQLLVATETFAVGINLPCKCTLFPRLIKWNGDKNRYLEGHEYIQQAGRAGRRGFDNKGEAYHLVNLFDDMPPSTTYKEILAGKPQALVSKFKISFEFVLNIIDSEKDVSIESFANNSMISEEIKKELSYLDKTIKEKQTLHDSKENSLQFCTTSLDSLIEYKEGLEKLPYTKNKKKKALERSLDMIKTNNKMFSKDYDLYTSTIDLKDEINKLQRQYGYTEDHISYNVEKVYNILVANYFINNDEKKLTESGIIAHNIKEIHSLAFADTMKYCNYFENFTSSDIAAYLSIYSQINVKDDYKKWNPDSNNSYINDVIKFTKERIDNYESEETRYEIFTGTCSDINYDIINYIHRWCLSDDPESAKKILGDCLYQTDLFVGDFVKAILKINNIVNEIDRVCDLLGNKVELQNKIREIPKLSLKFVATNQSLYI